MTVSISKLARDGASDQAPCGRCGKRTKSHVVRSVEGEWAEFDRRDPLDGYSGVVDILVVCHECYSDIGFPVEGNGWVSESAAAVQVIVE